MKVSILNKTPSPEQLICEAARGDYESRWIGELDFVESMDEIEPADPDEVPEEARKQMSGVSENLRRRMWTLISHLLEHGHFGPFEHPHITFTVKGVSRSLMAQITRHRHVTFDIQSMRYVSFEDIEDPEPGGAVVSIPELEEADPAGRNVEMDENYQRYTDQELIDARDAQYRAAISQAFKAYGNLIEMGTAPENARMVLPIGTKINMTFTLNARMLMHVADMRAAADAQWEIRQMTEDVLDLAREWAPMTFAYYEEELKNRKNRLAP